VGKSQTKPAPSTVLVDERQGLGTWCRRHLVVVLLALGFGASSAQQFWPVLRTAAGSLSWSADLGTTPAHPGSLNQVADISGVRAANPVVASLGTDDFGSETPRSLVLVDTSPGRNAREGTARLGTNPANPQTYSAGAILLNGARLTEILPDYIVLERGGGSVRLYAQGRGPAVHPEKSPLLQVGGTRIGGNLASSAGSLPDDSRTAAIRNYIRFNPVLENEQLRGFELLVGARPEAFPRLGLLAGDVLTQFNGVKVTDGNQVMDMLERLFAGAAIDATVERGGRSQRVTLDGSVLSKPTARRDTLDIPGTGRMSNPSEEKT
jgi:general secretion pathway protein C